MVRFVLGWVIIALLIGCSSKEEQALLESFAQNNTYHKHLQRTEKAELFDGNSSVAFITVTHLYAANNDKNDTRDEVFIVGVQFEDRDNAQILFNLNDTSDGYANKNEYILTLENRYATKVVPLSNDDERLKKLSFITEWGEYYEVTFPHAGPKFSLLFSNSVYGTKSLSFSKAPKFVYTNKGF